MKKKTSCFAGGFFYVSLLLKLVNQTKSYILKAKFETKAISRLSIIDIRFH